MEWNLWIPTWSFYGCLSLRRRGGMWNCGCGLSLDQYFRETSVWNNLCSLHLCPQEIVTPCSYSKVEALVLCDFCSINGNQGGCFFFTALDLLFLSHCFIKLLKHWVGSIHRFESHYNFSCLLLSKSWSCPSLILSWLWTPPFLPLISYPLLAFWL